MARVGRGAESKSLLTYQDLAYVFGQLYWHGTMANAKNHVILDVVLM